MENKELQPIVFKGEYEGVADILASSEATGDIYIPPISCAGVGSAACQPGCVRGCMNSPKTGEACQEICKAGCGKGCKKGCQEGHK